MVIKVIDALNKIANGITYTRKARIRYFDRKNDYEDECNLSEVAIGFRLYNQNIELNDEVEIIEEPQEHKIPEKLSNIKFENGKFYLSVGNKHNYIIREVDKVFLNKINEIIDKLDKED